jgi:hypothetical protein
MTSQPQRKLYDVKAASSKANISCSTFVFYYYILYISFIIYYIRYIRSIGLSTHGIILQNDLEFRLQVA